MTALREPEHGPFRRLMLRPAEARAAFGDGPVLAYATRGPVHSRQIGQLRHLAGQLKARLLLLPLVAGPAEVVTRPEALIRAVLAAAASLPATRWSSRCRWPPRDPRPRRPARRASWRPAALVAAAYGATHLMADVRPHDRLRRRWPPLTAPGVAIPVLRAGDWAYDPRRRGVAAAGADRGRHRAGRPVPR